MDPTSGRTLVRTAVIALIVLAVGGLVAVGPQSQAAGPAGQGLPGPTGIVESATPALNPAKDWDAVELGLRFTATMPGAVVALRFFKPGEQSGANQRGHLWDSEGNLLVEVAFGEQTSSGWQVATLAEPVTLEPGAEYVVSYFAPNGLYAATNRAHARAAKGSWFALPKDAGVYRYGGAGGFPTDSFAGSSYFVDAVFQPSVTVFGDEDPDSFLDPDPNPVELGMAFTPTVDGHVTGARFYKGSTELGTSQSVRLWAGEEVVAEAAVSTGEEPGWQVVQFAQPVALTAGTRYVVSYWAPRGRYVVAEDALTSPQEGAWYTLEPDAGVYRYGDAGDVPASTYRASNYFVDPVFVPRLEIPEPPQPPPPPPAATPTPRPTSPPTSPGQAAAQPMALISLGAPAFASAGEPRNANDDSYDSAWSPGSSGWLAYDLSGVPVAQRREVVLAWYTRTDDGYSTFGDVGVCPAWGGTPFLRDYTIEVNPADGGGDSAPETGWTPVVSVSDNGHLSGQHLFDLAGSNWVRIVGSGPNGIDINVDVADAGSGVGDGWLFMGDSITSPWAGHGSRTDPQGQLVPSFTDLVGAGTADEFRPLTQNGGRDCSTATSALTWIDSMLAGSPGRYVALGFGTNDGWNGAGDPQGFAATMEQLADRVIAAGKVPVIPTVPWPNNGGQWDAQVKRMNDLLGGLHERRPDILAGPDLYALLRDRPELYRGPGDVHPNGEGSALIRAAWAEMALSTVYAEPDPSAPPPDKEPAGAARPVSVDGNRLVDSRGQTVVLHGVNKAGSEYACIDGWGIFDGPVDQASIDAMKAWNINAVRVPLNSACWLDLKHQFGSYNPEVAGEGYRSAIEDYVTRLAENGMYTILELHWTGCGESPCLANWLKPMPDAPHAEQFWSSVASRFADQRTVLFDLFNEPTVGDWTCWAEGGCTAFPGEASNEFTMTGMDTLVQAVRGAGATKHPILLGGLQYANDMRGWLQHLPDDPSDSLVASIHLYNFNYPCPTMMDGAQTADAAIECFTDGDRNGILSIAEEHPVVFGELGQTGCSTEFVEPMLEWIGDRGFSVMGWAWNTFSCSDFPSLISSYDGTPTAFGEAFRTAYAAD